MYRPGRETNVLVTATASDRGAHGVKVAIAPPLGRSEVMHTRDVDARIYALCAGANNAEARLLDVGADACPVPCTGTSSICSASR